MSCIPVSCVLSTEAVMDFIPTNSILKFNSDTLQFLRTLYGLDKPERLEEAINILVEWLKKEDHLIKKDFSREYLERMIILSKGSVERTKRKHDKICTFKTLLPDYFEHIDARNSEILKLFKCSLLPKMTKDHYRVFLLKNVGQRFEMGFLDYFKYFIMICEYLHANDYCNGIVGIFDYMESNIMELMKNINFVHLRDVMSIIMEGYGMRIKGIHFLSTSKIIDTFIAIFKQAVSAKVAQRIHVHKDVKSLCEHLERDILPKDYGGKEKTIDTLTSELMDTLSSDEFSEYFNVMKQARTNEDYRSQDKFNDQYSGVAGSFRKLSVD